VKTTAGEPPARLLIQRSLPDGRIECEVCPHCCRLREDQDGLCRSRGRRGDRIVSLTAGRTSGLAVDPIEKKPLYHFLPGTSVLSFGTIGCNLACRFCQNEGITRARIVPTSLREAEPGRIARAAAQLGCRSVAFTYNDPVVFWDYAVEVATACRAAGIRTVAVTAGYVSARARAELFHHIDAANVDLKGFSEAFYRKMTGGHLQPVLDTLVYLRRETRVWVEITNLLIPGVNDSPSEIDAMTRWIGEHLGPGTPIHFTAFHPAGRMRDVPPTPLATLVRAAELAIENGLNHAYVGNARSEWESTWCSSCGELLVVRDGYRIVGWHVKDAGHCAACGARCPGEFEESPGDWGARTLPVDLDDVLG
jgi:pyruvate formate lyase activating enzyme